jgi:hypothetical protein
VLIVRWYGGTYNITTTAVNCLLYDLGSEMDGQQAKDLAHLHTGKTLKFVSVDDDRLYREHCTTADGAYGRTRTDAYKLFALSILTMLSYYFIQVSCRKN